MKTWTHGMIALWGLGLAMGQGALAATTYYVDVKYTNGNSDGTSTKPWTNIAPAMVAFTNATGNTIMVAAGRYASTNANGYETFGTNGYTTLYKAGYQGTWKGGYKGWDGSAFDWTEANRILPSTNVSTSTMTVIDLTNANSRAFWIQCDTGGSGIGWSFDGFVFQNALITSGAGTNGGALYLDALYPVAASASRLLNCVFLNNSTIGSGGALWCQGRYNSFTNLWFVGNRAGGNGGAAVLSALNVNLSATNIVCVRNSATGRAGAIQTFGGTFFGRSTFIGNTAGAEGGAVAYSDADSSIIGSQTFRQCLFSNNTAGTYGGAVGNTRYKATPIMLENCLVANNTASSGYALYVAGSYISDSSANIFLVYTTIANNSNGAVRSYMQYDSSGGAKHSTITATNCIIANNGPVGISAYDGGLTNVSFGLEYNIIYGQTTNYHGLATNAVHVHDQDVDPKFASSSDYHLKSISPCRDAATNIGVAFDLEGTARPYDAQDTGFDIGCYEMAHVFPEGTVIMVK